VSLSDPRVKAKASERQGKTRHLLYLLSEIHVAPRGDQVLHRVRVPVGFPLLQKSTGICV
jgi:hypothetical protein